MKCRINIHQQTVGWCRGKTSTTGTIPNSGLIIKDQFKNQRFVCLQGHKSIEFEATTGGIKKDISRVSTLIYDVINGGT